MPPVQTTYSQYMPGQVIGQIADMTPHEIVTRIVQTPAGIQFGAPAFKGEADGSIVVAGGGNTAFDGFVVLSPTATPIYQPQALPGTPAYNVVPYEYEAAVLKRGTIWVVASVAVTPQNTPGIDPATGNIVTSTFNGYVPIPGASFENTAAAGAPVKLRIS